eukprot:COSAG02_NODE_19325_length_888_cov_0.633714_1_plen_117_part_00
MEIGNQGDFKSDRGMILTHFTYWVIIKSNLLISTLLDELSPEILQIVTNKDALACACVYCAPDAPSMPAGVSNIFRHIGSRAFPQISKCTRPEWLINNAILRTVYIKIAGANKEHV